MRRHWNSKGKIIFRSKLFALSSLLFALCLILPDRASSGPYLDSAHGSSSSGVKRSATTDYGRGNCVHCHEQHASIGGAEPNPIGGPDEYLVFQDYSGNTSKNAFCNKCHTSIGSLQIGVVDDIATSYTKTYKHTPTMVSCIDCHKPHTAQKPAHTPPGNTVAATSPIRDTWGVEPSFSSPGTPPAGSETLSTPSYTKVEPITKEYQLCLKCHSSYSYGGSPPLGWTDQGKEFNPYNYCFHPVTGLTGQTWKNPTIRTNYTTVLKSPWNATLDARMYCSDCHGDADTGTPKGPHGSNKKYMLKAWGGVDSSQTVYPNAAYSYDVLCLLCHSNKYLGVDQGSPGPWPHTAQVSEHCYNGETTGSGSGSIDYQNALGCRACHGGPAGWADLTGPYEPDIPSNGGRAGAIHGVNFYWQNPTSTKYNPSNPADKFLLGGYLTGMSLDEYAPKYLNYCWAAGLGKNDSPCGAMSGGKQW